MQQTDVTKLMPLSAYREQRQHIFASKASLDWYLRQNRDGLIDAGSLLLVAGRWFADPERFDEYVLTAGKAKAQAQLRSAQS